MSRAPVSSSLTLVPASYEQGSASHMTLGALEVVEAMRLMITSSDPGGLPRQLRVIWAKRRCSTLILTPRRTPLAHSSATPWLWPAYVWWPLLRMAGCASRMGTNVLINLPPQFFLPLRSFRSKPSYVLCFLRTTFTIRRRPVSRVGMAGRIGPTRRLRRSYGSGSH